MSVCGTRAFCGRPLGHKGSHGGWRTQYIAPTLISVEHRQAQDPSIVALLTLRQLQVVAEFVRHGDAERAAACLGITTATVRNHMAAALARTGAVSSYQLPFLLGWTTVPKAVGRHERVAS